MRVQAGRDEGPGLIQAPRAGPARRRPSSSPDRHEEGCHHAGGDHVGTRGQRIHHRLWRGCRRSTPPTASGRRRRSRSQSSARIRRSRNSTRWAMKVSVVRSCLALVRSNLDAGALCSPSSSCGRVMLPLAQPADGFAPATGLLQAGGRGWLAVPDDAGRMERTSETVSPIPDSTRRHRCAPKPRSPAPGAAPVPAASEFLELHLTLDVGLDVGDVALHAPEQMSGGARDLWAGARARPRSASRRRSPRVPKSRNRTCVLARETGRRRPAVKRRALRSGRPRWWCKTPGSGPVLVDLLARLAFDGLALGESFCWEASPRRRIALLHPFLEALHRATEVGADVAQLLVPNTRRMMTSTISQCQMLKEPIPPP